VPNRILREGILTSPRIAKLGWAEEVFYRRLHSVVDDFGRYYADHGLLHAACYPRQLNKVTDADIGKWLTSCVNAGLVSVYPAEDGERYLELCDFGQQIRAKKSRFPQPPSECVADAAQVQSGCVESAHLDVSVSVSEDVKGARPFVLPEWIPGDTWAAYLKTRSGKKAKNEPHALGLIVKDLEAFQAKGHDPVVVLNNSIKGGWAGVFEPKTVPGEIRAMTVPSKPGRDPALQKLDEDARMAAPMSDEIRVRIAGIVKNRAHA
jgi:hypothetical protein